MEFQSDPDLVFYLHLDSDRDDLEFVRERSEAYQHPHLALSSHSNTVTIVMDDQAAHKSEQHCSWYDALESDSFQPTFYEQRFSFFKNDENCTHSNSEKKIFPILESYFKEMYDTLPYEAAEANKNILLKASAQLARYLPELEDRDAHFFIDNDSQRIGILLKEKGTLTILIGGNSELSYSYAERADRGGLFRMTGTAKLTKNVRNSKYIKKILNLYREI